MNTEKLSFGDWLFVFDNFFVSLFFSVLLSKNLVQSNRKTDSIRSFYSISASVSNSANTRLKTNLKVTVGEIRQVFLRVLVS